MAYAFVQVVESPTVQTGLSATITINGVVAGNLLVLGIETASDSRVVSGVADTKSNSWSVGPAKVISQAVGNHFWYAENAVSGNTVITVSILDFSASMIWLTCAEYSGILTSGAFDRSASAGTDGVGVASLSSGSVTTRTDGELIVAYGHGESASPKTLNLPDGFTSRSYRDTVTTHSRICDKRQATQGSVDVTFVNDSGNNYMSAMLMTFREAAVSSVNISMSEHVGSSGQLA